RFGLKLEWTQFKNPAHLARFALVVGIAILVWTAAGIAAAKERREHLSMAKKDDVFMDALALPATERAALLHALALSLEEDAPDAPAVVEAEWSAEIVRRVEELRAGQVKTVDGAQMVRTAREELRRKHGV
ncbi:MAG: addiction module protein, partial [Myxococcota bacterium]